MRPRGFYRTGKAIVEKESVFALYKGLGAVMTGIVPKMAIRFTSYEWYKQLLTSKDGKVSGTATFFGEYSPSLHYALSHVFCSAQLLQLPLHDLTFL